MSTNRGLFNPSVPKKQLHPSYKLVQSSPRNKSTRRLMNDAFGRFVEKDGNFVEQFQTTMQHRLNKKTNPSAYWELPHVAGHPFILAIQTFHEHGSLSFSNAAIIRYLYGIEQKPSWDSAGNLVIITERVVEHSHDGKVIPSGFIELPDSENVSAVLWTNAGTVPKFTRMALSGPYPDEDVSMIRYGCMIDHDPNAHNPLPFVYIVGEPGAPTETWGQEANLFHNPKAKHPLPIDLFETVTNSELAEGQYVDHVTDDFKPIISVSNLINGAGHRRAAGRIADALFESLRKVYPPNTHPED